MLTTYMFSIVCDTCDGHVIRSSFRADRNNHHIASSIFSVGDGVFHSDDGWLWLLLRKLIALCTELKDKENSFNSTSYWCLFFCQQKLFAEIVDRSISVSVNDFEVSVKKLFRINDILVAIRVRRSQCKASVLFWLLIIRLLILLYKSICKTKHLKYLSMVKSISGANFPQGNIMVKRISYCARKISCSGLIAKPCAMRSTWRGVCWPMMGNAGQLEFNICCMIELCGVSISCFRR